MTKRLTQAEMDKVLEDNEANDKAANEAKAKDEAIRAEVEQTKREMAELKERTAKAEGLVEGMKTAVNKPAETPVWTDAQWQEWEGKTGMKREALLTMENVVSTRLSEMQRNVNERVSAAELRAKQAEDKYNDFDKVRSYETTKRGYLSNKPQYAKYEKDFDEFVNEFPEEMRKDPKKLESIFAKAEIYIRGKVGDKNMRRDASGSERFGRDSGSNEIPDEDIDLTGLRGYERNTIEKIITTKEGNDKLRANMHDLQGGQGIMINAKSEWDIYKK